MKKELIKKKKEKKLIIVIYKGYCKKIINLQNQML